MREPVPQSLTVRKGGALRQPIRWRIAETATDTPTPVDLSSGWSARSQLRVNGTAVLTLDSDPDAPDRDGSIDLGSDGSILLYAAASVVAGMPAGSGAWSLELTPDGGDPLIFMEGRLTVLSEVTR